MAQFTVIEGGKQTSEEPDLTFRESNVTYEQAINCVGIACQQDISDEAYDEIVSFVANLFGVTGDSRRVVVYQQDVRDAEDFYDSIFSGKENA